MSQFTACVTHPAHCPGCAGSGTCWVCLGTGYLVGTLEQRTDCHRCNGTGDCPERQSVPAVPSQSVMS
jgi:DnaJ-class molecular chaperone